MRDVIDRAGYRPFEGRRRVVIIDEADTMVASAQNALLKTLEEPPPSSVFILVTSRPDMLLPTVRSRCPRLRFQSAERDADRRRRAREIARDVLAQAAAQPTIPAGGIEAAKDLLAEAAAGGRSEREQLATHLRAMSSLLRDVEVLATRADAGVLANADVRPRSRAAGEAFGGERGMRAFPAVDTALTALDRNASVKIVADWLVLRSNAPAEAGRLRYGSVRLRRCTWPRTARLVSVKLTPVGRAQTFLVDDSRRASPCRVPASRSSSRPKADRRSAPSCRGVPQTAERRLPGGRSAARQWSASRRTTTSSTRLKHQQREREAHRIASLKIRERGLGMKLTRVEQAFDGSRLIFYFTAEGRVDFRELVRELAAEFHTRIEMRQIGVRDEAKMIGGYGTCGRPLCCTTFLTSFEPVSIKMAKQQDLSLNPSKLSGLCGRLKCCLRYELPNAKGERARRLRQRRRLRQPDRLRHRRAACGSCDCGSCGMPNVT